MRTIEKFFRFVFISCLIKYCFNNSLINTNLNKPCVVDFNFLLLTMDFSKYRSEPLVLQVKLII